MTKFLKDRTVNISTAIETATTMMMMILIGRAVLQQSPDQDLEVDHISVAHHLLVPHPQHYHLHRPYQLLRQLRPQQLQHPHHSRHNHVFRSVLHRNSTRLQQSRHQPSSH